MPARFLWGPVSRHPCLQVRGRSSSPVPVGPVRRVPCWPGFVAQGPGGKRLVRSRFDFLPTVSSLPPCEHLAFAAGLFFPSAVFVVYLLGKSLSFFLLMATPPACGSSRAGAQTRASPGTPAAAIRFSTHCPSAGTLEIPQLRLLSPSEALGGFLKSCLLPPQPLTPACLWRVLQPLGVDPARPWLVTLCSRAHFRLRCPRRTPGQAFSAWVSAACWAGSAVFLGTRQSACPGLAPGAIGAAAESSPGIEVPPPRDLIPGGRGSQPPVGCTDSLPLPRGPSPLAVLGPQLRAPPTPSLEAIPRVLPQWRRLGVGDRLLGSNFLSNRLVKAVLLLFTRLPPLG